MKPTDITFIGYTTFRNELKKFGIKVDDRRRHMYILGKTGMGKTELLKNLAIQDILKGNGIAFIDPHGEAADDLLDYIPKERINDVVYFNPADINFPIGFNVMEKVKMEERHLIASGLMNVFKKIWPDVWSARMEYILNNSILALLEYPSSTLLGINRMLSDPDYRKEIIDKVTDPVVKSFWVNEFSRYTQRYEVEATAAIQNKIGQFISNPLIRNIIGQKTININIRKIMDEGKILIANLSKGKIGEDNSSLLGALLVTKIQQAAMSRVDIKEEERRDFYLYVDEFQNFATEAFVDILSEARKYHLCLILSHQYISQMIEQVRDAVFGNVGTIIIFRVGAEDAQFLEKEFYPSVSPEDLVNLGKYHIYIKLLIDGLAGNPFSAITLPPYPKPKESYRKEIIEFCQKTYGRQRERVEKEISEWAEKKFGEKKGTTPASQPAVLYDALCFRCSKRIKIPFLPDPERPVYCKSCLKKIEKEQNGIIEEERPISLDDLLKIEPTPFKKEKKEEAKENKDIGEILVEILKKDKQKEEKKASDDSKKKLEPGKKIKF